MSVLPRLRLEGAGRGSARYLGSIALSIGLLLAIPAVASAATYYVNGATGDDTNTCLQPTVGAPPLGPCDTIDHALDLAQANTGVDQVLVTDGTYPETLVVNDGTALRTLDTTDPKPVINNSPAAANAVTISGTGGSVDGFEIRSDFRPLQVAAPGSVTNNDFPTVAAPTANNDIFVSGVPGNVLIAGNEFTDDGIGPQVGVVSNATSATSLTIQNNSFSGLNIAIWVQAGDSSPLIADNEISGVHTNGGAGVLVYEGSPTITHNTIHSPGAGSTSGVNISDTNGLVDAALSRNTITGHFFGVVVIDTSSPATLNGDLITGSAADGIQASNFGGGGDVDATNVTVYGSTDDDIQLQNNNLNLDSSIVGNTIETTGTAVCALIEFSRGPTLVGPITGCGSFQTLADPIFVNPAMGNYHLQTGSPMIDAGNTLDPGAGALDIDGNPRALSGTPACTLMAGRRDMGADEFVPATGIGCPVPPTITPTPAAAPPKKCKKGRKLKKGKCVKKKRKKP